MRIFLLALLLFASYNVVSAQPIFRPFKGEREIRKVRDINKEEIDITKKGDLCGEYFLYQVIGDQKIVSFQVPGAEDDKPGVVTFNRVDVRRLIIKLDEDKIKIPTAEFYLETETNGSTNKKFIIRISKNDYETAGCLFESQ
ncbi:MAG: hypothetical protein M3209_06780 [Acidobacteriota bacterium]|nr:hypothetical protein [Acidobacteriota bacterium]